MELNLIKRSELQRPLTPSEMDGNFEMIENAINENAGGGGSTVEIVNDLTTGGATKALSAEQGKVLQNTKASTPIPLNYIALKALIDTSALVVGQRYIISDYQTVHTIPNTGSINIGDTEPLLVTAISVNKLAPEAYSVLFPNDIIYYSPANDQTMVPGCTKGYIYRRIDTIKNNDIGFDFRNVKFRRWQISQPTWNSGETYNRGSVVKHVSNNTLWISIRDNNTNNSTGNSGYWRQFEFDNLSYISPFADSWDRSDNFTFILTCTNNYQDYKMWSNNSYYDTAYNNKLLQNQNNIISDSNSVIFGNYFYNNRIGNYFSNNSIGNGFYSNSIGNYFNNNSIGNGFYDNSIGNNFNNNSAGDVFNNNSIGSSFYSNSTGDYFASNSIGNDFYSNMIGNGFSSSIIGSDFNSNSIGANCYYNSIGSGSNSNIIGNNFYSNSIGNEFYSNSVGNNFYYNSIGNYFNYNRIGNYFSNNSIGNSFESNSVGNNFNYNRIGNYFNNNSIGNGFYNNSIGNDFQENNIADNFNNINGTINGIDFTNATYVYQQGTKELFKNSVGGQYLKFYDENNVLQIVAANG